MALCGMIGRMRISRQLNKLAAAFKRARGDISQAELAYRAGVSASAISGIESGRRADPRISVVAQTAEALEMTVDELIGNKK